MTATVTTTIQGVSVLTSQKKRGHDVFEIGLSHEGIEVRRPGRAVQQMSWDRVSEWEIEERKGYVLLTLRGRGATTPLVVPGWTLDDLELLMRDVTSDTAYEANGPGSIVADGRAAATASATATAVSAGASTPAATAPPAPAPAPAPVVVTAPRATPVPTRAERRQRASRERRRRRQFKLAWKPVVTVVLLGALATAIILVLLQSAGVINWSFLGPIA